MSRRTDGRDDTGLARPLDLIHNSPDSGDGPPKPSGRVGALLCPVAAKLAVGSVISKRLHLSWTTANCRADGCESANTKIDIVRGTRTTSKAPEHSSTTGIEPDPGPSSSVVVPSETLTG